MRTRYYFKIFIYNNNRVILIFGAVFRSVSYIHKTQVTSCQTQKLDVCEWWVFAKQVTYVYIMGTTVHSNVLIIQMSISRSEMLNVTKLIVF